MRHSLPVLTSWLPVLDLRRHMPHACDFQARGCRGHGCAPHTMVLPREMREHGLEVYRTPRLLMASQPMPIVLHVLTVYRSVVGLAGEATLSLRPFRPIRVSFELRKLDARPALLLLRSLVASRVCNRTTHGEVVLRTSVEKQPLALAGLDHVHVRSRLCATIGSICYSSTMTISSELFEPMSAR